MQLLLFDVDFERHACEREPVQLNHCPLLLVEEPPLSALSFSFERWFFFELDIFSFVFVFECEACLILRSNSASNF